MMRVAALYDIHGNLPALEAVLADVRGAGVDLIVIGGDVLPGPMPRGCFALLQEVDIPVQSISGNGDRFVLEYMRGETDTLPEQARASVQWSAEQLDMEHELHLASLPPTLTLDIDGLGAVLFCHATPRNDMDIFTRLTPEETLAPIFAGVTARVVVCGHTHMQFDRTVGKTRVVNAGSVGMPFAAPGAYWLLLGPDIVLRRTGYDIERAAERIAQTDFPQARDFAQKYILNPPSEQEMLELYSRVALR